MNQNASPTLEAIRYRRGSLELLDQRLLPHKFVYEKSNSVQAGWDAIQSMMVRGAPAIAITAALSLAVEASTRLDAFGSADAAADYLTNQLEFLATSRPTAVNLFEAVGRLKRVVINAKGTHGANPEGAKAVLESFIAEAETMLAKDVADNKAIGQFGAALFGNAAQRPVRILTHCNTGSLATASYGTALGVIRALHAKQWLEHAYATETRPYNQGARLTAFELVYEKIPATLITDSMAAFLMLRKGIDGVVVGADRVVANGDTANKIGTYQLAIAARYHGIPFYVAAPTTSIDVTLASGNEIIIEERPRHELTHVAGIAIAAEGIGVWNPSFDVTPACLITGIITEKGVISKSTYHSDQNTSHNAGQKAAPNTAQNNEQMFDKSATFDVPGFLAKLKARTTSC